MPRHFLRNFIMCALLLTTSICQADIMIEQGKVEIKANPGETVVNTVRVYNTSKTESMRLRVSWEDFVYVAPFHEGRKEFMPAGTLPNSFAGWVTYSPLEFTLEPSGTKQVTYSFQVPADARGGYYGVLLFQEGGEKIDQGVGVSLVTRVGSLFFLETTNSDRSAKIENIAIAENVLSGEFFNLGNVVIIPEATYYLMDSEGLVADRGEIKKFYLPGGEKTPFDVAFTKDLQPGTYTIILTFDVGAGVSIVKEVDFKKQETGAVEIFQVRD